MENNFLKNFWFWVVIILVAGVFLFYVKVPSPNQVSPSASPSVSGNARLEIFSADAQIGTFQGPVTENMTILNVLNSVSKGGGLTFRYVASKNGDITLLSLDNISNTAIKKWQFYLNGEIVNTSRIDKVIIKSGDLIEVKFE